MSRTDVHDWLCPSGCGCTHPPRLNDDDPDPQHARRNPVRCVLCGGYGEDADFSMTICREVYGTDWPADAPPSILQRRA